ncbi:hypothetical protein [Bremerella cremea]|uniref:hypothetical protein n=1 Tax=Bremerella cremea TaxID=1031537 RepID=UPI0031EEF22C
MSQIVTLLIMFRIIFCPLFCGAEMMFAAMQHDSGNTSVVVSPVVSHGCCKHCTAPEPAAPSETPHDSSPDCDCFCSESAIVGMKVDLDDLSAAAWPAYLPLAQLWVVTELLPQATLKSHIKVPGIAPGRSMRLVLASLQI